MILRSHILTLCSEHWTDKRMDLRANRWEGLCQAEPWGGKRAEVDTIQGVQVTYSRERGRGQSWEGRLMARGSCEGVEECRTNEDTVTMKKGRVLRSCSNRRCPVGSQAVSIKHLDT